MITPHQSCTDWLCCRIICWLNSAHVGPHTGPQPYRGTKPLFQIASTQSSVVQGREGTYCPLRTLPHSFEEQPSLIINRHTKLWAPNNTEQIPLCVQVLNISATTVCPPPLPLLFRYLHISERCGGHKRYSQLSFSPASNLKDDTPYLERSERSWEENQSRASGFVKSKMPPMPFHQRTKAGSRPVGSRTNRPLSTQVWKFSES